MNTWQSLLETAKTQRHRNFTGVHSCSKLPQLSKCTGSAEMQRGLPSSTSPEAIEGIAKHMCCQYESVPADAPQDVAGEVWWAVSQIESLKKQGWTVHGREVFMTSRDPKLGKGLSGSADVIMKRGSGEYTEWLFIDYKFGYRPVRVEENYQLMGYASLFDQPGRKFLAIIQPKMYRFDMLVLTEQEIAEFEKKVRWIYQNENLRIPSAEACRYCTACAVKCPESIKSLDEFLTLTGEEVA